MFFHLLYLKKPPSIPPISSFYVEAVIYLIDETFCIFLTFPVHRSLQLWFFLCNYEIHMVLLWMTQNCDEITFLLLKCNLSLLMKISHVHYFGMIEAIEHESWSPYISCKFCLVTLWVQLQRSCGTLQDFCCNPVIKLEFSINWKERVQYPKLEWLLDQFYI